MRSEDPPELVDVLYHRGHLMGHLLDGRTDRRELAEELEESRSTVYRGLDRLAAVGLATETNGRYAPTKLGKFVYAEYERFLDVVETASSFGDVIERFPDELLSRDLLEEASIHRPVRHAPAVPLKVVEHAVRNADSVEALVPVLLPRTVQLYHDLVTEGRLAAELVLEEPTAAHLLEKYPDEAAEAVATGSLTLLRVPDGLPCGLVVAHGGRPTVCVVVYGPSGDAQGVLRSRGEAPLEWAEAVYRRYRADADPLDVG